MTATTDTGVKLGETWHATPRSGTPYVAHLLTTSWPADRGGARPSACGQERRRQWRPLSWFSRPEVFQRCPQCAVLLFPPAQPSGPAHDPYGCTPALPAGANTAAARVARRVAFRNSIPSGAPPYQDGGPDRRPPSWLSPEPNRDP